MDFNHLKDILSSVVGTVSVKGKEFAEVAVDKTKAAGRVAKASLELTAEKETLKKAYAELGQAYYENCREGAEGVFQQLCEEIAQFIEKTPKGAYQSETFDDYSYTRAGGKSGGVLTWQEHFSAQLSEYRRMFTEVSV